MKTLLNLFIMITIAISVAACGDYSIDSDYTYDSCAFSYVGDSDCGYYSYGWGYAGYDYYWYWYSDDSTASKDLEKVASVMEVAEAGDLEAKLVEYGLSEARASKLSKLATSFSKLSGKRSLTAKESNIFTNELLGIDMATATSIIVDEGKSSLIERAAEHNGTSPEAVTELLETILK